MKAILLLSCLLCVTVTVWACSSDSDCTSKHTNTCCVGLQQCKSASWVASNAAKCNPSSAPSSSSPSSPPPSPPKLKVSGSVPPKATVETPRKECPEEGGPREIAMGAGRMSKLGHPVTAETVGVSAITELSLTTGRRTCDGLTIEGCFRKTDDTLMSALNPLINNIKTDYADVLRTLSDSQKEKLLKIQFHNSLMISQTLNKQLRDKNVELQPQMKWLFQYFKEMLDGTAREAGDFKKASTNKARARALQYVLKQLNADSRVGRPLDKAPAPTASYRSDDVGIDETVQFTWENAPKTEKIRIDFLPHADVTQSIESLFEWVAGVITSNDHGGISKLELAARVHGALISIHPFLDGNGRSCMYFALYLLARGNDFPLPNFNSDLVAFGRFQRAQTQGTCKLVPLSTDNKDKFNAYADPILAYFVAVRDTVAAMKRDINAYLQQDVDFLFNEVDSFLEESSSSPLLRLHRKVSGKKW